MSVPHHIPEIRVHYDHPVDPVERLQVSCAEELHQAFLSVWEPHTLEYRESFYLLLLNRRLDVLWYRQLTTGGLCSTLVDVRQMLAIAIKGNAWAIAIGHNHPSANAQPSMSDKAMTERIHQACALLDIMLIDHIILLPPDRYYSFSDHGLLKQPNNKQSSYVKSSTTP